MQDRKEHFRFTIDGVDHDFECTRAQLHNYFEKNYPNYTLDIMIPSVYTGGVLYFYVQYQQFVQSQNPHKGEKKTNTVELTHLFGFKDGSPYYVHYTAP